MYLLLIFDTIEYNNCLEEVYICFNKKDYKEILKKYENQIKRGYIDYIVCDLDNEDDYKLYSSDNLSRRYY